MRGGKADRELLGHDRRTRRTGIHHQGENLLLSICETPLRLDLSASGQFAVRKQLGDDLLSFAMPFTLFQEMEANVEGSFLQRHTWQALLAAKRSRRSV